LPSRPGTGSRFGIGIFAVIGTAIASNCKDLFRRTLKE